MRSPVVLCVIFAPASKKITTSAQLDAAYKYFKTKDNFDAAAFDKMCGVGTRVVCVRGEGT